MGVSVAISLVLFWTGFEVVKAEESVYSLPALQTHPLPSSLVHWKDERNGGDYFNQIRSTPVGYLVWSEFPLKIYVQRPSNSRDGEASFDRFQQWVDAVLSAVDEWNEYLPLVEVEREELADIVIKRSLPPLKAEINPETGLFDISPVRSGQTKYKIYLRSGSTPVLSHRMTVEISPTQSNDSIIATARHELGHALGIWGHSTEETDAMYLSGVRNPPPISPRDINTLKKIYQQPTRLGWSLQN
ncbi:MAG: matrixin family metalloprotease [Prochloraceae cyanobacterium]|nr:matrixin family metalloprotease [Prochloraceae cyanobacterium]